MPEPRKQKIGNLKEVIGQCLDVGRYLDTRHAHLRQWQRLIKRPEILYVLKHGYHEKGKDTYEEAYREWNYSIRGKTPDGRELRVVISFEAMYLIIITAVDLGL